MNDTIRALGRAAINVATLIAGGGIGALAVLFWAASQPSKILSMSTMDPVAAVVEPFVIPWLVWLVGIGGGLFHAAAILKFLHRI